MDGNERKNSLSYTPKILFFPYLWTEEPLRYDIKIQLQSFCLCYSEWEAWDDRSPKLQWLPFGV